jgi:hypothetical protein
MDPQCIFDGLHKQPKNDFVIKITKKGKMDPHYQKRKF